MMNKHHESESHEGYEVRTIDRGRAGVMSDILHRWDGYLVELGYQLGIHEDGSVSGQVIAKSLSRSTRLLLDMEKGMTGLSNPDDEYDDDLENLFNALSHPYSIKASDDPQERAIA